MLLAVALTSSHAAVCAGWMGTPEARMACCAEGGACPMHESGSPHANVSHTLTQAEADRCCAASEDDQSSQSSSTFAAGTSIAVLGTSSPLITDTAVAARPTGTTDPLPPRHVPKHVLHSVFLV